MDQNYLEFLVDRLGDVFISNPDRLGETDRANLVQALQELSLLTTDKTNVEDSDITAALDAYRYDHPLGIDDMQNLYARIEQNIPITVDGNAIKVNMAAFDSEFKEAIEDYIKWGLIYRLDFSDDLDVEFYNNLKESVRTDFANIEPIVIPELTNDTTTAERQENNPEEKAFVMITPHDNGVGGNIDYRLSVRAKWEAAHDALEDAGAHITVIDGQDNAGSGREVYVRDRALIIGDVAYIPDVLSRIEKDGDYESAYLYKKDADQMREFLQEQGYEVVTVEGAWFEGGNVILHQTDAQNTLFLGMDYMSDDETPLTDETSAQNLIAAINATQQQNWTLQGVPMIDTQLGGNGEVYHLDLGMTYPLPNGEVLIYPGVTDEATYARIQEIIGIDNIIEIDKEAALQFATNFNQVGNTIVMTGTTPELQETLEERGYKVVSPEDYDLESLEFGLGGVHCITNEIKWTPPTNTQ